MNETYAEFFDDDAPIEGGRREASRQFLRDTAGLTDGEAEAVVKVAEQHQRPGETLVEAARRLAVETVERAHLKRAETAPPRRAPTAAPRRARASRRTRRAATRRAASSSSGDGDGEPPPPRRPLGAALVERARRVLGDEAAQQLADALAVADQRLHALFAREQQWYRAHVFAVERTVAVIDAQIMRVRAAGATASEIARSRTALRRYVGESARSTRDCMQEVADRRRLVERATAQLLDAIAWALWFVVAVDAGVVAMRDLAELSPTARSVVAEAAEHWATARNGGLAGEVRRAETAADLRCVLGRAPDHPAHARRTLRMMADAARDGERVVIAEGMWWVLPAADAGAV